MLIDPSQAELTVCTTVISKPGLLDEMELSHEDFLDSDYGLVYRTAKFLHESNKDVNMFSVMDKLMKRVPVEKLQMACDVTRAEPWAVVDAAHIVKDAATRRRVIHTAQRMMELANSAERMDENTMAEMQQAFEMVSIRLEDGKGPVLLADILPEYWKGFDERRANKGKLRGANTGFHILDLWLHGWLATYLIVIGARPSVGKTAFMLQSAYECSVENCVVVFSIEMYRELLIDRMLARNSWTPLHKIIDGDVDGERYDMMKAAKNEMEKRTFYIDDSSDITVPYMRSRLRRIARQYPNKKLVVYVDYLQIIKSAERARSEVEEIAQIARGLKSLAKELKCSVVALAQLNRDVDKRKEKKPSMSDLKGSGQIEQEADVIMMLTRDDYYEAETENKEMADVVVSKNRNGETGTAQLKFKKEFQRFVDIAKN